MRSLKPSDLESWFGKNYPEICNHIASKMHFSVISDVIIKESKNLKPSGPERLKDWENGWKENYISYLKSRDPKSLIPHYYSNNVSPLRYKQSFIKPKEKDFEANQLLIIKHWMAQHFTDTVYEFGCGPSNNLIDFLSIKNDSTYIGLDWSTYSGKIIEEIPALSFKRFDMFKPDKSLKLKPNSTIITMDSIEQLGRNFKPFMDYIVSQKPKVVIHQEPIYEMYQDTPFDNAAKLYHLKRNYCVGLLGYLKKLYRKGSIDIKVCSRTIGGMQHEARSIILWTT